MGSTADELAELRRYRAFIEHVDDLITVIDPAGRYTYVSPSVEALVGLDQAELVGSDCFAGIHRDDRAAVVDAFQAVTEQRQADLTVEYRHRAADGSWRWLQTTGTNHIDTPDIGGVLTVSRDVTERRRREQELATYRSRLETAMDSAHFAWWEMSLDSGDVAFSEHKTDFLGVDAAAFSHYEDFTSRIHPDDYEATMQAMRDHMAGEAARYETKYRIRDAHGEYVWFHDVGQISDTTNGSPESVIGITLDITTQRQYEQRLAALNVALADLLTAGSVREVSEIIVDIVSKTVPELWATIALVADDGVHLDQLFMTESRQTLDGDRAKTTGPLDERLWVSRVFQRGEAAEIRDYRALDPSERLDDDFPFRRARAVPLGRHGVFVLASPSTDPFERSVADFVDVLVQVAETVYDRVAREVELRAAKASLEQRQNRLDAIVQNAPVVLFSFDPSGTFTHSSGRGLSLVGLEEGEAVGQNVFEMYAHDEEVLEMCRAALSGESVVTRIDTGDIVFQNWFAPTFDGDGDVSHVYGVSVDITAEVRQEARLTALSEATNELVYARSVESVGTETVAIAERHLPQHPIVMWLVSDETERLEPAAFSQRAIEAMEGHTDPSGIGPLSPGTWEYDIFERGTEHDTDDYRALPNASHPGAPLGSVVAFPLGDHALFAVGSVDGPFEDTDRNFLRILARTAEAALDRAAREQALEAYKDELERSNENLQEFAYIASHDLQEPLRMVSSYVSLLAREYQGKLDAEADEYIHFAVDGAERMKSMIDALLAYSRVHTRAQPFEEVDLETVLADVIQSLSLVIEETGAVVTHDPLPTIECDGDQLGQVFQNLLANGIENTGDGPPEIHITAEELDDEYCFSVEDNGVGIPADEQTHIFDIFKRGGRGTSSDGTGIGLAICERIVRRHGGDIWVESRAGDGATFYLTVAKGHQSAVGFGRPEGRSGDTS